MIVAKKFKWEAAHRIQWHAGKCRHLHGHSYKMTISLEGEPNDTGMVIDFNELKKIVLPHIELMDHTTLISEKDEELKRVFDQNNWKYYLLPFDSTAENLCNYFADLISRNHLSILKKNNIQSIGVKIFETESAFAYTQIDIL